MQNMFAESEIRLREDLIMEHVDKAKRVGRNACVVPIRRKELVDPILLALREKGIERVGVLDSYTKGVKTVFAW